eukprot:3856640-Alexandrium_andersonii.AAC.1
MTGGRWSGRVDRTGSCQTDGFCMERRRTWWVGMQGLLSERCRRGAARIAWSRMGGVEIETAVEWLSMRVP